MSALAAIVIAHNDPAKVRRLIMSLTGVDVFLHCDGRTPDSVAREMVEGLSQVTSVPRGETRIFTWSLVDAELRALRLALERSSADHIIVMSGSCYPLASVEAIADELAGWRGLSRFELNPLPYAGWSARNGRDGGSWRFERRFLSLRGRIVTFREAPIPLRRRRAPNSLEFIASSGWKIYARTHARALLDVLDGDPEIAAFWRSTWTPDESCAASILQSRALVGDVVDEVIDDLPWYMRWGSSPHPAWLGKDDFHAIEAAATAPQRPPTPRRVADRTVFRKLFARKIASNSAPLLDLIDGQLRH